MMILSHEETQRISAVIHSRVANSTSWNIVVYVTDGAVYAVRDDSAAAMRLLCDDDRAIAELVGVYSKTTPRLTILADLQHWLAEAERMAA